MLSLHGKTCRVEPRSLSKVCLAAIACVLAVIATLSSAVRCEEASALSTTKTTAISEAHSKVVSGPKVGSTIHQFFVRAVTGPHRNRSVCYVCRYGSRPVVMVMMQKPDPKIATLLKAIDAIVDVNRVSGLRSFGVLVTDESARAVPILQTMAFDERIRMPLTAATTAIAGPSCHNLHKDAATTVILYRDQEAVKNFAFAKGTISDDSIIPLIEGVKQLIEPRKAD
ncbi:MAG: hypothetical protein ACKVHE_14625 [Planctomycetales bacterium]|jgi:hypothetical protein